MPLTAATITLPAEREATRHDQKLSPLYKVVLLDDDAHTYAYVVEMLTKIIGCPVAWAFQMAIEVDTTGRVIVDITTYEEALDLQKKIHNYGADWRMSGCQGSMTAIIEPAD